MSKQTKALVAGCAVYAVILALAFAQGRLWADLSTDTPLTPIVRIGGNVTWAAMLGHFGMLASVATARKVLTR